MDSSDKSLFQDLKGAFENAMSMNGIGEVQDEIDSFEQDKNELTAMCEEIDKQFAIQRQANKLLSEAQEVVETLAASEKELNVTLDYGTKTEKELFEQLFGLEFKVTEGDDYEAYSHWTSFNNRFTLYEAYSHWTSFNNRLVFTLIMFMSTDRAICFSFFNLNPEHPEQRYDITMDIEDDQWKVVHVTPLLHGLRDLISQLNSGGELKTFCKQIRQKFIDTLDQPS